ncbi:hypothetical protein AB0C32_20965, partial [Streptosporangium sp. NPDC048865]
LRHERRADGRPRRGRRQVRGQRPASGDPATDEPASGGAAGESRAEPESWTSPGDVGWQAAQAASAPVLGGTTEAGLPRRTPRANLVPGSVTPPARPGPSPAPGGPALSPERVRSRMSSFQEGVRKARNELPKREE